MKTRILLADDHVLVRQAISSVLDGHDEIDVVGEADDGREAVRLSRELHPDVVIMDIGMPGLNGVAATRQIKAENPEVDIIALSMHSDKRYVYQMLEAGAKGYLVKDSLFDELMEAIQSVVKGQGYLSRKITNIVIKGFVSKDDDEDVKVEELLTPRESEVLQLLAEGKTSKEIAADLYISVKTVENHRKHICKKLNLHSTAELTKFAIKHGLTFI